MFRNSSGLSIVDEIKNCCVNKQNQRLFEIFLGECEVCIKGKESGVERRTPVCISSEGPRRRRVADLRGCACVLACVCDERIRRARAADGRYLADGHCELLHVLDYSNCLPLRGEE